MTRTQDTKRRRKPYWVYRLPKWNEPEGFHTYGVYRVADNTWMRVAVPGHFSLNRRGDLDEIIRLAELAERGA